MTLLAGGLPVAMYLAGTGVEDLYAHARAFGSWSSPHILALTASNLGGSEDPLICALLRELMRS